MAKRKTDNQLREALRNWWILNERLPALSEADVVKALELEKQRDRPRRQVLVRLHSRYCALRRDREREELMRHVRP